MNNMEPEAFRLLLSRLDSQDAVLGEIKAEVKKTNGRVTTLEKIQYAADLVGDKATRRKAILIGLLVGCAVSVVGAAATVLLAHWLTG